MENNTPAYGSLATDQKNAPNRKSSDFDGVLLSMGCIVGFAATAALGHCLASAVCLGLWFALELAPLTNPTA